jgi:predicted nucleic acid-binding Zn ribbon protein
MGLISIGDALKDIVKKSRLKNGLRAAAIEEVWEKIMGKTVAKYTNKIQIINQKLFITTHVAALKNELHFQKDLIKQRINEEFGETVITDIIIQ